MERWASVHAKQAKIVAVFREFIPPERHQEFLDRLEGRTPPPSGGARLALVEGTTMRSSIPLAATMRISITSVRRMG